MRDATMSEVRMSPAAAPHNPLARLLAGVNRSVMHVVGAVAAALVVVETAVLLTGVFYRYALHDPLIWSDELASTLFIWLSMLGAVLA
uniref:TRAP transporter small permease subunit n=1 Tax=Herbaspirillum sp. RV1423 TaxID=1443993 RepID=UPI00358E8E64